MILLLIILLAPAAASLWTLFGGKKAGYVALAAGLASLAASGVLFEFALTGFAGSWHFAGLPGYPFQLEVSYLNAALSLIVAIVTALIFLYALGYMADKQSNWRFWSSISLFLAAMQLLVFAGDWILFVMAWEILGFCSYLLISTTYWQPETGKAANKAFAINRCADLGLYLGVFVIILSGGSSAIVESPAAISTFGALCLFFGVMGKSAQVPFQSWLTAAMKGPTPVSALLHSATMVAAGIVLLIKAFPMFTPPVLFWIGTVGAVTILMTGLTAIFSDDIKKMLAASSSSQLGFMVLAIGAGSPGAALAHLAAHAFMKSSLFMAAGVWQHAAGSTRFKMLAGAGKKRKFTFGAFALAAVALAGIPPFVGYFSKDAVLSAGLKSSLPTWYFAAALLGALMTAFYMARATGILWKEEPNDGLEKPAGLKWMQAGLATMIVFVVGGGLFLHGMITAADFHLPKAKVAKIGGLVAALVGLAGGWVASFKKADYSITSFIRKNYPVAGGYRTLAVAPVMKLASWCREVDESIHKLVLGIGRSALQLSGGAHKSDQTIHGGVQEVGRFGLTLGDWSQRSDEQGINGFISALTRGVQELGQESRKTQSGLVHRELMWSVWGLLAFVCLMLLTLI